MPDNSALNSVPPSPLNNPLTPHIQTPGMDVYEKGGRKRGVVKRGKTGGESLPAPAFISYWLLCPTCLAGMVAHLRRISEMPYLKCDHCGQMNAIEAWNVIAYGNYQPAINAAEATERRIRAIHPGSHVPYNPPREAYQMKDRERLL